MAWAGAEGGAGVQGRGAVCVLPAFSGVGGLASLGLCGMCCVESSISISKDSPQCTGLHICGQKFKDFASKRQQAQLSLEAGRRTESCSMFLKTFPVQSQLSFFRPAPPSVPPHLRPLSRVLHFPASCASIRNSAEEVTNSHCFISCIVWNHAAQSTGASTYHCGGASRNRVGV